MKINIERGSQRKTFATRVRAGNVIRSLLILLIATGLASAQSNVPSTDRDNPSPLTSNEIRGTGIGKNVEYFYTFTGGPDEVVLTVDARATAYSTFVEVLLFNMEAQQLGVIRYGPTTRSERKITRIRLGQQQPLLLQIALDSNAGDYLIRLGGMVQLDTSATLSPTPTDTTAISSDTTAVASPATESTSAPVSAETPAQPASTDTSTTTLTATTEKKASRFQKLWMRLGAASEVLGLSKIGKLKIEMKDGTSQEIGLLKIKKVFAPKGSDPSSAEPTNEGWQRLWMKLGSTGELMNLATTGSMRVDLQDGTTQEFDLTRIKKVSLSK
jgi:hypothetical protein